MVCQIYDKEGFSAMIPGRLLSSCFWKEAERRQQAEPHRWPLQPIHIPRVVQRSSYFTCDRISPDHFDFGRSSIFFGAIAAVSEVRWKVPFISFPTAVKYIPLESFDPSSAVWAVALPVESNL
jgi:hypothetical protein